MSDYGLSMALYIGTCLAALAYGYYRDRTLQSHKVRNELAGWWRDRANSSHELEIRFDGKHVWITHVLPLQRRESKYRENIAGTRLICGTAIFECVGGECVQDYGLTTYVRDIEKNVAIADDKHLLE